MDRTASFWIKSIIHNMVIHPVLPAADALHALGLRRVPAAVYWLHDHILPVGAG